ncbi:MAG: hypothetical protein R6U61_06735 [Thermoplasmata archaeon]
MKHIILNFFTLSAVLCILISTSTAVHGGDTPAKIKRASSIGVGTTGDIDLDTIEKTVQVTVILNNSVDGWNKILIRLTDGFAADMKRTYGYGFTLRQKGGGKIVFELRTGENKSLIDSFEIPLGTDKTMKIVRWTFKIDCQDLEGFPRFEINRDIPDGKRPDQVLRRPYETCPTSGSSKSINGTVITP